MKDFRQWGLWDGKIMHVADWLRPQRQFKALCESLYGWGIKPGEQIVINAVPTCLWCIAAAGGTV